MNEHNKDEHTPLPNSNPVHGTIGISTANPPLSHPEPDTASPPDETPDGLGGYRLMRHIGKGAFGEVYEAEAPGGIRVAIKLLLWSIEHAATRREVESLEAIKQLSHPFLLKTGAYWAHQGRLVIVMELADGSLADRMKHFQTTIGKPCVPTEELVPLFEQAAEALDYLHSKNVTHRDIKPQNLLIVNGYAKVADFGLAGVQEKMTVTISREIGTPVFMAPEVWNHKISRFSDQYSLAVSYVTARLGHPPFAARDILELHDEHMKGTPNLDPLPRAEQQVLLKALAKQPDQRYPNCTAFVAALRKAVMKSERPTDLGIPSVLGWISRRVSGLFARMPNFLGGLPLDKALELSSRSVKNHDDFVNTLNELQFKGEMNEAVARYRESAQNNPEDGRAPHDLGDALMRAGKVDEAATCYQEALRLDLTDTKAHTSLAVALRKKSDAGESVPCDPAGAKEHFRRGVMLRKSGDVDGAIVAYQDAIRLDLIDAELYTSLGVALRKKGDLLEAIDAHRTAIRLDPLCGRAHYNLAKALMAKGKLDEAIFACQEAIRIDPNYPKTHYSLAIAYVKQRRYSEATTSVRAAIDADPKYAKAQSLLQRLLRTSGK